MRYCVSSQTRPLTGVLLFVVLSRVALADPGNVLFVIVDDAGVDVLEAYGEGLGPFPHTPTIDALRTSGVMFRNAYSNPACSPTRAGILTGRHGFRTGVGCPVSGGSDVGLALEEFTIPEVLDAHPLLGFDHAAFGKWHLTSAAQCGPLGPNYTGFGHFAGAMRNLREGEGQEAYTDWAKVVNGVESRSNVYATTDNVNDALEWMCQTEDPTQYNCKPREPWFIWLAFNAPHDPFHIPPDPKLYYTDPPADPDIRDEYRLMVEAIDMELGRFKTLLEGVGIWNNTTVIFVGDNGTPAEISEGDFIPEHAKGTLYEGGINVPLIISGNGIINPNRSSDAIVNTVDLFATALELMGADVPPSTSCVVLDSRSLVSILEDDEEAFDTQYAFAESFFSSWEQATRAMRDDQYKIIRFADAPTTGGACLADSDCGNGLCVEGLCCACLEGSCAGDFCEECYDLVNDPFETTPLPRHLPDCGPEVTGDCADPSVAARCDALSDALTARLATEPHCTEIPCSGTCPECCDNSGCVVGDVCCAGDCHECCDDADCPTGSHCNPAANFCEAVKPGSNAIPSVSSWGLVVLILATLTAGSVILSRRRHSESLPTCHPIA